MPPKTAATLFRAHLLVSFVLAGLIWAAGALPAIGEPARLAFDILKWPLDGDPGAFDPTARFVSAIGGGVLVGLGVLNLMLVAPAIESGDRRILNAGMVSTLSWFVIDSTASVAAGAASNAVFNAIILALYLAPLLLVRRPT